MLCIGKTPVTFCAVGSLADALLVRAGAESWTPRSGAAQDEASARAVTME